jgi:hypothetical protein
MTITRRPWSTLKKSSHKASQITTRTTRSRLAPFWKFMNSCNVTTAAITGKEWYRSSVYSNCFQICTGLPPSPADQPVVLLHKPLCSMD